MGRKSIFKADDISHIVECLNNGMSYRQIADNMNVQYQQIYQWCRNNKGIIDQIQQRQHDEKLMEYLAKGCQIMSKDEIRQALMGGRS